MGYVAKGGTIDVPIHGIAAKKLRVVEGVKCFEAQLDSVLASRYRDSSESSVRYV